MKRQLNNRPKYNLDFQVFDLTHSPGSSCLPIGRVKYPSSYPNRASDKMRLAEYGSVLNLLMFTKSWL